MTGPSEAVAVDRAVRRMTVALAVMSLASFGTLSFTFSVMLGPMGADLGWSNALLSSGFTLGSVVGGALAAFVGRTIDLRGGRRVLVTGSFVGAAGMLAWSLATTPITYLLAWVVIGVGMSLGFYEPTVASAVRHAPGRRRDAVLTITLAGALASTIWIPLGELLISLGGWRTALMQLALLYLLLTLPLNLLALPRGTVVLVPDAPPAPREPVEPTPEAAPAAAAAPPTMFSSPQMRRVALASVLGYAVTLALGTHLVAFLVVGGRAPAVAAALAAGLGVGKLLGRLGVGLLLRRTTTRTLYAGCHFTIGVALSVPILLPPGPYDLATIGALGMSAGALTVVRPLYIADLFGSRGFGLTAGRINRVNRIVTAFVPLVVGSIVTVTGSYTAAWTALAFGVVLGGFLLPRLPASGGRAVAAG